MPDNEQHTIIPSAARRKSVINVACQVDLKDPDLQADKRRHDVFRDLRRDRPVYWNPEVDGAGFWAVTRYEDVLAVVQDPETYSADVRNGGMRIFNIADVTKVPRPHLLSLDPPLHTAFRKTLQPLFSPKAVSGFETRIRCRAAKLVAAIAPRGSAEFVSEIAEPMTIGLLIDLLDVDESDAGRLLRWSNIFVGDDDPDYQSSVELRQQAVCDMDDYVLKLYGERAAGKGRDFVSLLRKVKFDGQPLDFDTFSVNFGAFVIAGNETTRHAMSAMMVALTGFPAERQKLIDDPTLIPVAAKEFIRWATPLMHVRRTAMCDAVLGGQPISKGDKVVVWYSSANRDESQWPDAAVLDVGRYARKQCPSHLAFGAGVHHCLGWRYAELQIAALIEELLRVIPDIAAISAERPLRSNFIAGIKELQVGFTQLAR